MDGFIFVSTNFRGLNKNDTFVGFKIRGYSIFFHNSYRKLPFRGFWNSRIGPSTKTTKIGTQRKLSHPQYGLTYTSTDCKGYKHQETIANYVIYLMIQHTFHYQKTPCHRAVKYDMNSNIPLVTAATFLSSKPSSKTGY